MEKPCEETGGSCEWIWCCEICDNTFCSQCYRSRDWNLNEYNEVQSDEDEENDATVLT